MEVAIHRTNPVCLHPHLGRPQERSSSSGKVSFPGDHSIHTPANTLELLGFTMPSFLENTTSFFREAESTPFCHILQHLAACLALSKSKDPASQANLHPFPASSKQFLLYLPSPLLSSHSSFLGREGKNGKSISNFMQFSLRDTTSGNLCFWLLFCILHLKNIQAFPLL